MRGFMLQSSAYFLTPGIALLKVIEGTVGEDFNSFVPTTGDDQSSTVYPYSALTIIIWIVFVIIMPVLFANLLVGRDSESLYITNKLRYCIYYRLVWRLEISKQFMRWQILKSRHCR